MELDFDKEIDALMRRKDFSPAGTTVPDEHLDADEIAAFADNAVPEAGRAVYTRHLAACDRCRRVLSSVVSLKSESGAAPETSVEPAATESVPWYQGLFSFPGLAYALGGLIVVFGGFLAFSVMRDSGRNNVADVSQVSEQTPPAVSGPSAAEVPPLPAYPVNTADASANTAANSNAISAGVETGRAASSNAASSAAPGVLAPRTTSRKQSFQIDGASGAENNFVIDGQELKAARPPAATADSSVAQVSKDKAERSDPSASREMLNLEVQPPAAQQEMQDRGDSRNARAKRAAANAQTKIITGPGRDMNSQYGNAQIQQLPSSGRRIVSGRNFELRQGVWYDAGYNGQAATTVKRGTEAYIRLDAGLRSIADTLGGAVVIVWKGRAYRIQ